MKRKLRRRRSVPSEAAYVCDSCGEEVVIPVDLSQGLTQEFVEDCPICCRPNVIRLEIDDRQEVRIWAEGE
jgi:DNA replicative helicase MCM subunit Mcm2 (Cdc46/Mcm family)